MATTATHQEPLWDLTPEEAAYINRTFADTTEADADGVLGAAILGEFVEELRIPPDYSIQYRLTEKGNSILREIGLAPSDTWLTIGWYQSIVNVIQGAESGQWDIVDFLAEFFRNIEPTQPQELAKPFIAQCEKRWEKINETACDNFVIPSVLLSLCGIELHNKFSTFQ